MQVKIVDTNLRSLDAADTKVSSSPHKFSKFKDAARPHKIKEEQDDGDSPIKNLESAEADKGG
jgi:hypothetical protein